MTNFYANEKEIRDLVQSFRTKQLPEEKWTHEAHLTTGIWFLKNYNYHESICYLRSGIIEYNASLGNKNTPSNGYHETITLFWMQIMATFIKAHPNKNLLALCNAFLDSEFADKQLFAQYYHLETLFSVKARAVWVMPDKEQGC